MDDAQMGDTSETVFASPSAWPAVPPPDPALSLVHDPAPHRPPIRVLPAGIAARIAAGETIERPASVVKELIENALDAGATAIRVDIQGGGFGLIRVGDDGVGIRAAELWLACQRHATSKLAAGDRLDGIRSLGFRGEALPSIAAVAELSLLSAADISGVGWTIALRDGQVVADEPAPRPRGTTVTVRHLFQNLPARLAAAAKPQTESTHIGQIVRRLAIAAPAVRLTLVVDNRIVLQTGGSGDLAAALIDVYGHAIGGSLLPLGPITIGGARCRGVLAGPEVTRPGRSQINLIVNGRWVQARTIAHALETAYRPLLPRGRHPVLALVIETAPDRVDVNVHPAKLEVRLRDERALGAALGDLLRNALGRRPLDLDLRPVTGIDALRHDAILAEETIPYDDAGLIVTPSLPPLRLLGQLRARLLLLEGDAGLYLIDQHRAHERIIFERLVAAAGAPAPEPVPLAEPLLLELRPSQLARFSRRLDQLAALGFTCEVFGGRSFLLRTAPVLPGVVPDREGNGGLAPLTGLGHPGALAATLLAIGDEEAGEGETWRDRLLVQLSCRTAVRRGVPLDRAAMRALVLGLGHSASPAVCPHGSPLLMHVGSNLLERQFGWR